MNKEYETKLLELVKDLSEFAHQHLKNTNVVGERYILYKIDYLQGYVDALKGLLEDK